MDLLEGNVVVGRRAGEVGRAAAARLRRRQVRAAATALTVAAAVQELHRVCDDLDGLALRAVVRLPLAPLQAALDADAAALGEVLGAILALLPPHGDVEVVRLLAPLA